MGTNIIINFFKNANFEIIFDHEINYVNSKPYNLYPIPFLLNLLKYHEQITKNNAIV